MIHHEIGTLIEDGEAAVRTQRGEYGFALYGPYHTYEPGIYAATFSIVPDGPSLGSDTCGWAEVTASEGQAVFEKTNLYAGRLLQTGGRVVLEFALTEATELEFRVYSNGRVAMTVAANVIAAPIPAKTFHPMCIPDLAVPDEFFQENASGFRFLYEHGCELTPNPDGVIVTYTDVSFYLRSPEVFHLANEIFFQNEYNFLSPRNAVAVDIGMNIGLTSLYMARDPRIIEVHGFEPFRAPFECALENFNLNPQYAKKITANNIGLADCESIEEVLSGTDRTIDVSIKGRKEGTPEKIVLRPAAEMFEPIIADAKSKDCDLIVKIDCEGSEFAILESLTERGLLKDIRVIMMEWHKWWSAEKSQKTMVDRLLHDGFIVFDRTNPADPHAGIIYGVRTV